MNDRQTRNFRAAQTAHELGRMHKRDGREKAAAYQVRAVIERLDLPYVEDLIMPAYCLGYDEMSPA